MKVNCVCIAMLCVLLSVVKANEKGVITGEERFSNFVCYNRVEKFLENKQDSIQAYQASDSYKEALKKLKTTIFEECRTKLSYEEKKQLHDKKDDQAVLELGGIDKFNIDTFFTDNSFTMTEKEESAFEIFQELDNMLQLVRKAKENEDTMMGMDEESKELRRKRKESLEQLKMQNSDL